MGRLFWKFFFAIWLVQALAVLGLGTSIWFKDRDRAWRNEQVDLAPHASFMVEAAATALRYGGVEALRSLLQQHGASVYAVDGSGQDLLGRKVDGTLVARLREMHVQDPGLAALQEVHAGGGDWLLYAARPPRPGLDAKSGPGGPPDHGAGGPGGRPHHHSPRSDLFPMMPMLLAMLGSLISAALLARHFTRPIRRLSQAFDEAAAGKLDTRIGADMGRRRDELTDLGRDFDRMAQRLQSLVGGQRRLLHDVSHEMRSPLARLQAAIGLARQRPDRIEISLERIERESTRMDAMIGELLTLSRLEAGVPGAPEEDVNVGELVAAVVDDARFEAQAEGTTVALHDDVLAHVRGNAQLLHSAVENVVRNAIKHTAPQSEVALDVTREGGLVRIAVSDRGPGVPEEDLERIFLPFERGSQGGKLPGHGLGLAIAERIVRAHGGTIRARNRAGGGLMVEIALPATA